MQQRYLLKQFLTSSVIFFVGTVLSKAISILMLPLYTSYIPTADMGYYDVSVTYITVLTSILFFDIWVTILRFMYDGSNDDEKAMYVHSGCIIFAVSSLMYMTVAVVFSSVTSYKAVTLVFVYGLFTNINYIFTFLARGYERHLDFAISGILNTFVNVASNVILILLFSWGYKALYVSGILGATAQVVYISIRTNVLYAIFRGRYDKHIVKKMLFYTLPLCINSVAYWLITSYNRLIINKIYGDSANGIYAVGSKFAVAIGLVTMCFTYAWQEIAFSEADKLEDKGRFYSNACILYSIVLCISIPLMLPFIKMAFPIFVHSSYNAACDTIPLFLITAVISAVSTFVGNIFYAIKNTKIIFISMAISAVFNIIVSYPLIKYFNLNGANLATTISFMLNIAIRNKFLHDQISFSFDRQILIPLMLAIIGSIIYIYCDMLSNILYFILTIVIVLWLYRHYIPMIINFVWSLKRER